MCQELDRSRGEEAARAVHGETRRALPHCVCLELDRSRGEETAHAKSIKYVVILTIANPDLAFTFVARSRWRLKQSTLFVSFYSRHGTIAVGVSFSKHCGRGVEGRRGLRRS